MRRTARAVVAAALLAAVCTLSAAAPAAAAGPACTKAVARQEVVDSGWEGQIRSRLGASFFRPGESFFDLFGVGKLICSDVTGDGTKEMVVLLRCCTVSSPSPWAIFKASAGGGWRLRYSRIKTVAFSLRVNGDGDVEEKAPKYAPSDPNCCPSSFQYVRAHWTSASFQTLRGKG